jgi:hypothetical protein
LTVAAGALALALFARHDRLRLVEPDRHRGFDRPDAAEQYAEARRLPTGGSGDTSRMFAEAAARRLVMPRFASRINRALPDAVPAARMWSRTGQVRGLDEPSASLGILDTWTPLGPGNIGGRTRIVRYHPTQPDILFAAGVSGGVWRSDDNGGSWRPIAEGLTNIAVNAFIIDARQPEVMYAGTGEGHFREEIRGTGLPLRGGGIFVTRNGGGSWTKLASTATPDFHWVNDLEQSANDKRLLYAATRTGVWRSTDAGETWQPLLTVGVRGGCLDIALQPGARDDVLLASCGSYEQATVYRFPRASAGSDVEPSLAEPGMGRTSLAFSPSNPAMVYALAASNDPGPGDQYRQGLLAVYRSDRGGAPGTWQPRVTNTDAAKINTLLLTNAGAATIQDCGSPSPGTFTNMGWYINVIAVDPRDPERVWAAGVDWFRSDDGGRNWGLASTMAGQPGTVAAFAHVDQHAVTFHPGYDGQGNQQALIGNDGGVYRTANARGRTSTGARAACSASVSAIEVRWESLNRDYGVTQFYHGAASADGSRYAGGAQDNGTLVGADDSGFNGWRTTLGGDGAHVALHPSNPQIIYAESQWANIAKTIDGGTRWTSVRSGLDPIRSDVLGPEANYLFVAPFVMDPSNPERLWLGGEFLYRTVNGASVWTRAGAAMPDGGVVSALAVSAADANHVVAGTNRGDVVRSRQALSAGESTDWASSRAREGWVTSVAIDPRNANIVYATYGNFGGAHVYRSADGGATWSARDGGGDGALPDIPVHAIVIDPDDPSRLYLGTDLGVFTSVDAGLRWMVEETGFGAAVTEWLTLTRDGSGRKRLFAFTHGRGAWRVELR